MKFYFSLFLLLILAVKTISAEDGTIELYVSALGNDSWSGTLADPNSEKTVENQITKALRILKNELKDYLPLLILFDSFHFFR